jgi:hypothetical protein
MEVNNIENEMGMGSDIDLMNSDLHIVQDVEADLEEYTRLNRLGRFGEASRLFRETLQRHLGCFAVLAEHCNALLYQGDYVQASLVLQDSIGKQTLSATGSLRFERSELHFLHLCHAYVNIFAERSYFIGLREARIAVSQARWYRDTIAATDPRRLMDVEVSLENGPWRRSVNRQQRQVLLTCLRIFVMFVQTDCAHVSDLRLPWSSPPSYPGQTLNLFEDYLAWFEFLLPEHPWDACIVLQAISLLKRADDYVLDMSTMIDMVERSFPETDLADVNLFARMQLLGTLCAMALEKRWCQTALADVDGFNRLVTIHIVVDSDSERLAEIIQRMLRQHSGAGDVTGTRAYKYLELLIIDHELIREHEPEDARTAVIDILSRLSAIEEYATSPRVKDHRLAMEVIYHYYLLQPRGQWRKTILNKIARFMSRFGKTQETLRLHSSIFTNNDAFSVYCHPTCAYVVSRIIRASEAMSDIKDFRSGHDVGGRPSQRSQSIFEGVLQVIGDRGQSFTSYQRSSLLTYKKPRKAGRVEGMNI